MLRCPSMIRLSSPSTSEVRSFFQVAGDTLPAAGGTVSDRARRLVAKVWRTDTTCAVAFDAGRSWLVYVNDKCHASTANTGTVRQDGDALVQVSRDGRRVIRTLLNPGGIDFVPL